MSKIQPIDCTLHDHLEAACLFGYELEVLQKSGAVVFGSAQTTRTAAGMEYLVLKAGGDKLEVPMHDIDKASVRTLNAIFTELAF